ncbi:ExbD/TolR family protein [Mucilaginibacter myungsuensis]|uniref:Biopolymer transporter ExbD n=1 Tax=Mucilaginibacter myungsuensis TaxID=649104 RepID=A0A929PYL9_9SPHI|nr:biopolymer transporter ExbD [Mucilaginibacter myungsuensis]MBE9663590.1 biopolymer transporter ExbD [Mucilaginibacter myungsuensis]MDN3599086.1 biopolymer transporter ExbD [Mucilaginibacter myungsuensis]
MNLKKRHKREAEVHTSAMNDIMFFLMLFFLIASTVTNPNVVKLVLPKSASGQSISKKTVQVSLNKDLQYTVDRKPVAVADLETNLSTYKNLAKDLTIVLSVDKTVDIQEVVNVMDIAQKLNIKMVLKTAKK